MNPDPHRRDAYASAGARVSQRSIQRSRTATQDLSPAHRARRQARRRKRSTAPTLLLAIGLILGFVAICFLLLERNQEHFDPFTTIEAQLRAEAPNTFATDRLDGIGQGLVLQRLEQGHSGWFTAARAMHGDQQRQVMADYWDRAARELAAAPAVQEAYRRAELSFAFRGKWFGSSQATSTPAQSDDGTGSETPPPTAPAAERPTAAPPAAAEPAPAPRTTPEPDGSIERLM